MATYLSERIRKGLPRVPGGPGWPDVEGSVAASGEPVVLRKVAESQPAPEPAVAPDPVILREVAESQSAPVAPTATVEKTLRQGLPRTPGGDPWPPAGTVAVVAAEPVILRGVAESQSADSEILRAAAQPQDDGGATAQGGDLPAQQAIPVAQAKHAAVEPADHKAVAVPVSAAASVTGVKSASLPTETVEVTLRQGLPRSPGGEPWPPAGTVAVERAVVGAEPVILREVAESQPADGEILRAAAQPQDDGGAAAPAATAKSAASATATPAPAPAGKPAAPAKPKREPVMIGSRTLGQWVKLAVLWGGGAIVAAGILVLAARGVTTLPGVPEFLERYPGEYHLPEFVDPGFPAWARWAHFLNFFLMVLIIRSGLLVRQQQKPDAFFTPKKGGKKISIYLWLHTSLDILWLLNGVAFVVLLFVTGHWARIVPTSWEVFPNAISAALQYGTLEWPVEDGWVNYNSLQQIMYFTVVFIAAPLAAITGVRMSEWWPKNAEKLNKLYPAPLARAIHYPTMLFFVLFIIIHVFLVFTTGALKNLNHMFAGTPEISWVGFWWFAAGLLVTAAVTWAARPLVLAPIAGLFGRVSER